MPDKSKKFESPDQFLLRVAEDLPTQNYTRSRNADTWRNLLSHEDYMTRERVLSLSRMATIAGNKLVIFTLSSIDNPSVPLCSCEVMIRAAWKYGNSDGQVSRQDVRSGCIGGVYTYPENRGRGLATIMIDKLVALMKTPDFLGPDGIIFLYSEVGEFYARNGFKSFHVPLLSIPLTASGKPYSHRHELIPYKGFGELFEAYSSVFDQTTREKTLADGNDRFAIVPNADIIDWFHLRTKFFGTKLFGDTGIVMSPEDHSLEEMEQNAQSVEPHFFGLKVTCPETGVVKGFIAWQLDYNKNKSGEFDNHAVVVKVHVDTTHFDEASVTRELIEGMMEYLEADHGIPQLSNFSKVVVWESEIPETVAEMLVKEFSSKRGLENSSMSAMLCNNPEEDTKLRSGKMIWENNTKLPWF